MKERSIFWPLVMIATGVLWLMIGMDIIPRANLWALTHIFPFLLIALGLGLILRAYWRFAGMLVSLLVVAGAFMAVFYAPKLGWDDAPGWGWNMWDFGPKLGGAKSGSGVVETETRQVAKFNSISFDYPAEITILQGKSGSITIEAEDNLIPQLGTEVRNGTLYFENTEMNWNDRVNPSKPILVTITVVDLNNVQFSSAGTLMIKSLETDTLELSISGAGDVTITDLEAKNLVFRLSGAGNVKASGVVNDLEMRISGMGSLKGNELQSQTAQIQISGAGNATVWVEDSLDASISGAGSIEYFGNPEVNKMISGVGSVNHLGDK